MGKLSKIATRKWKRYGENPYEYELLPQFVDSDYLAVKLVFDRKGMSIFGRIINFYRIQVSSSKSIMQSVSGYSLQIAKTKAVFEYGIPIPFEQQANSYKKEWANLPVVLIVEKEN